MKAFRVEQFFLATALVPILALGQRIESSPGAPWNSMANRILSFSAKGSIKETAVLRSAPNATAPRAKCEQDVSGCSGGQKRDGGCFEKMESFSTVKAGDRVTIIAKTENTEKVGKWVNYWYKLDMAPKPEYMQNDGCSGDVWVFGEFVSIE